MLGLRKSPLARRHHSPSNPSDSAANKTVDGPASTAIAPHHPTANGGDTAGGEMSHLEMANKPLGVQPHVVKKSNGTSNGITNGTKSYNESNSERHSDSRVTRSSETHTMTTKTSNESRVQFSKDQQITVLHDTVISTRGRLITEFDHVDENYIDTMTIEDFLDHIERERLTHMPHRGSRWDKVLQWTEFFALQISEYADAVENFVPDSKDAVKLIWAACRVLLELGPENAQALETTFGVFYELGLSISFFMRHNELLHVNSHVRMEVGQAFNDMLMLVRDVSIYYRVRINDISSNEASLDFNSIFGRHLGSFYSRKNHITDAMWKYRLGNHSSVDIRTIRKWLSPRDPALQAIMKDRLGARGHRDEYTCEWFQRHLLDFSRGKDDILAVTGPAGCGKSVLYGWIIERLQRRLGRKTHMTLSYTIDADFPSEITSLAIARHLSLQLLESNVGDTALFDALADAHNISDPNKLEKALWEALDTGLQSVTDNLMIVIDGLNEVKGGPKSADATRNQLGWLASRHNSVQTVILSQGPTSISKNGKTHTLEISPDHTRDDIRHIVGHALHDYTHFRDQNSTNQENIVELLLDAAKGNFLWVILTTTFLKHEATHEGFMKAVNAVKGAPKTLGQTIQTLANTLDYSKTDTNLLLSWLLVAERPLTSTEVKCLLQVDLQKKQSVDRKTDIKDDIRAACGSLVVNRNGVIRFRHSAIRSHFITIQSEGKALLSYQAAQADLTMRLLAYCKFNITKTYEPVLECVNIADVNDLFQKHLLLEYAVRNWTLHFRSSSMSKSAGAFQLSSDFKAIFPSATQFAVLEWTCWESQTSTSEAISMHELALRIREDVFTEKHDSVLQSLIICGSLHRKLSNVKEAGACFYRASHIGQMLHKYSTTTIICTTTFLTITESITTTTRTELVTRKEEMLKYIIGAYRHQHGKTSDLVIRYYRILAQLYVDIHEEQEAEIIWRELREIIITRHGKGSDEETSIDEQITVVLKKGSKQKDTEPGGTLFDIEKKLEVWDLRRIKITLELAVSYEERGEFFLAEELYIVLWRRLTERCHHPDHHHGVEIHISTIDVVLEYVRFLIRRHRHEEASNVLICIWTEYEEYDFESETIFLRLKVVGELMRAISLLSIAVSVFKKCWGWFKSHGKHEFTASCEVLISETVEEIITSTTTTVSTSTTTAITETVIKEVFESTLSRTTVTSETISICKSLISYHIKLEQWAQAIEVTERSLTLIWKMIISGRGTLALPRDFGSEAIDIAMRLAFCHHRSHHFYDAEKIYIRIYRACRNSCQIHDERLTKSCTTLIKFYEERRHWHKLVEIYQELLMEYREHLGASHSLTIKTLYVLGSLCSEHGHGNPNEYYEEIITVLNGDARVCHHDATKAMIVICRSYYEEGYWHKLQRVCGILWETWTHHHHEHTFDADFIEALYMRYRYVLEHHANCDYEVLRTITIEYRDTCVKVFGASVAITIKALIELAQICMRSEKHIHEAISTYEEVLTKTSTTTTTITTTSVISTTTITTVKERLTKAYVTVCSHGSVSTTTVEKAIKVILARFEYLKITFGCASTETLTTLRDLVLLYKKLKTQEAHTIVLRMLLETTIEIIRKEKHSRTLYEAAKIMGGIYISCELSEYGREMFHEIRRQIITGKSTSKSRFDFKLDNSVGRISYVFLVTFEEVLGGSTTVSYTTIMADLLTETILYESYNRVKSEKNIEIVLAHGARLRLFLVVHSYREQVDALDDELYKIFMSKWGASMKTQSEYTFMFYISLLEELGKESQNVFIGNAACISSERKVCGLLEEGKYRDAFEVATCAFHFIKHQHAYHHKQNVKCGLWLSGYLAGRGYKKPEKAIEPTLRAQMLELSRFVTIEVLQACKDSNINFVRLPLEELTGLVGLLGEQQNYADLEWLLNLLWSSREVQKTWSANNIVSIGRRLVQARFLTGRDRQGAIRLCEDICYNLRRVRGPLHPKTLKMSDLLSQLYTETKHFREAMGVHENILRLVVDGDDDDDRTLDTMTSEMARKHLDLLKQSYLRLGHWDKSASMYKDLVDALLRMKEYKGKPEWQGVQSTDKWNPKEAPAGTDVFVAPKEWEFEKGVEERSEMGSKRASSSYWGLRSSTSSHGDHANGNGHHFVGKPALALTPTLSDNDGGNGSTLPKVRNDKAEVENRGGNGVIGHKNLNGEKSRVQSMLL